MTTNDPKRLGTLIEKNLNLPTIPVVASRALNAISDPRTSASALADLVVQDQGLTARVLSVANSVAYAPAVEIRTIHQAAVLLGFKTMEQLIVAASYRSVYKRFGAVEKALWEHSIACGLAAQVIAEEKRFGCSEEAFVAGLMHDVGRVVLLNGERDKLAQCTAMARDLDIPMLAAEQEVFGFTHAEVGALLIARWELSQALHDAVLLHHDADSAELLAPDNVELCLTVAAAEYMVHFLGIGSEKLRPDQEPEAEPALIELELEAEDLERVGGKIQKQFEGQQRSLVAA